jgi:hypothetical protein
MASVSGGFGAAGIAVHAMTGIGLHSAKSGIAHSMEEALAVQKQLQTHGRAVPARNRCAFVRLHGRAALAHGRCPGSVTTLCCDANAVPSKPA